MVNRVCHKQARKPTLYSHLDGFDLTAVYDLDVMAALKMAGSVARVGKR